MKITQTRNSLKRENADEGDEDNEYEKKRQRNIEEKMRMLKELGIVDTVKEINSTVKTKPRSSAKKKYSNGKDEPYEAPKWASGTPEIIRRSSRLSNKPPIDASGESKVEIKSEDVKPISRTFFKGPEYMVPYGDDTKPCLGSLLPHLSNVSTQEKAQKSLEAFKSYIKKFTLKEGNVQKVGSAQSRSFVLHPSEDKLLAITGDRNGFIGFWDTESGNKELYKAHKNPVFCLSVCTQNPCKLFATSIDGVVRSCDLEKMLFTDVYVSGVDGKEDHTPYHAQLDAHTLLVAHGCGDVAVVDEREGGKVSRWFDCHKVSVRTVQRHPFKEHEFITASRSCEAGIWDLRKAKKQKPLMLYPHPKGLKSAFFSPGGGLVLTSCNDDKLRLFAADDTKVLMSRNHNMQTGRWLNPFLATWHPHRDDVFIVGSLERPRKIDIYGIHGLSLAELTSPRLLTVLSNCQFHPSMHVIAGVNNSGYVHIFSNSS